MTSVGTSEGEEYVELVLSCVERIPRGRVTTYGAIADLVGSGPRRVGSVMSGHGGPVPWWRVVRADGSLPPSHQGEAKERYLEEGTPLTRSGARVDIGQAFWLPVDPARASRRATAAGRGRPKRAASRPVAAPR